MSAAVHFGLSIGIANQLAAVVNSRDNDGNIGVVVVIIISSVDVVVVGVVDGRVSVRVVT